MAIIMGIDVSTTTIGWCILSYARGQKPKLINHSFYKPSKKGNLFERLDQTRKDIRQIVEKYNPDYIAIEDLIKFMKGKSSATTIINLSVFNRMIGLMAYDFLGRPPDLFNVMSIRHGIRREIGEKKLPAKEELPQHISALLDIEYPWIKDKKGKIKIESYDVSDAMCVAYYCSLMLESGKMNEYSRSI
jgi:hypothetical protein